MIIPDISPFNTCISIPKYFLSWRLSLQTCFLPPNNPTPPTPLSLSLFPPHTHASVFFSLDTINAINIRSRVEDVQRVGRGARQHVLLRVPRHVQDLRRKVARPGPLGVAVHVAFAFESKGLKPRNHFIRSRVETRKPGAFTSCGSTGFNLYRPTTV
jgi:hypothetical protein